MCLAIVMPETKETNISYLRNGYDSNSHGAGFVYSQGGKLYSQKGFFTFEDFLEEYNKIPDNCPCLVHFRFRSAGATDAANCHPFAVNENISFIHNGTLPTGSSTEFSDTYWFNESILKPYLIQDKNYLDKNLVIDLGHLIGGGNKLCFLNNEGKTFIVNESKGYWEKGNWYSNKSYETRVIRHNVRYYEDEGNWHGYGVGNAPMDESFNEWIYKVYQDYVFSNCRDI